MFAEITKDMFNNLVKSDTKIEHVEDKEHYRKLFYYVSGVWVIQVENYLSQVIQYYVQDINA